MSASRPRYGFSVLVVSKGNLVVTKSTTACPTGLPNCAAAGDDISNSDPATLARAVALACTPEIEKLVAAANRDGDTKVADAIRKDSEFRATGYVLKARGQLIF